MGTDADVVEEHQRIAAGREDVVHVHRDEVLARDLELVVLEEQFQLRADAVAAGHDDGIPCRR
jgi:hypothetical protein